jgi:hypothetical protein
MGEHWKPFVYIRADDSVAAIWPGDFGLMKASFSGAFARRKS